jgi:hypothetical protein
MEKTFSRYKTEHASRYIHLLRGLQDCGNSMAVIAAEWKLGLLESHLAPGIASEDESVDNLSDFSSETHQIDEELRKFVIKAAEGNEDGQHFPKGITSAGYIHPVYLRSCKFHHNGVEAGVTEIGLLQSGTIQNDLDKMLVGYSVVLGRHPSAYRVWPSWKQPKSDGECEKHRCAKSPGARCR